MYIALADPAGARAVLRQLQGRRPAAARPRQPAGAGQTATGHGRRDDRRAVGASSLTAAELRLVTLLPTHLTFREIGERLYVSRHTVKSQAMSVYRKLGVSSRSEAIDRMQSSAC